jgi:L-lactate dehydrogenase
MTSIAVIGSGAVGVACAGPLLQMGVATRLGLYDRSDDHARGEALDFRDASVLLPGTEVVGGSLDELEPADVAVLAAGAHTRPGQTRLDLLDANLAVAAEVANAIEHALPRVLIVVSSPLDPITEYLTRRFESKPVTVFGTGTSLDSWRLRERLAAELHVDAGNVHAWVIGEHGDSAVFPFSSARVGPFGLEEFARRRGVRLDLDRVEEDVRTAAYEVRRLKGSTTHAIGLATARLVSRVVRDSRALVPVSVRVEDGLCASLPAPIGHHGPGEPLRPELSERELEAWEASLAVLREAAARIPPA